MKARIRLIPGRRRTPRTREESRRFAANVSRALVIAGVILAIVAAANRWARREELSSVRIVGRHVLDSAEIMRVAGVERGMALETLDLDSVEHRIAAHPFIEHASVYRGERGALVVEIAERAPVAVALLDGAPVYLDSLGVVLPYRFSSAGFDLPVLRGIEAQPARASATAGARTDTARMQPRARATGAPPFDSLRVREALAVLAAVRGYDDALERQVSEIRRDGNGEYALLLADDAVEVRLGAPGDIASRLRKLDRFLTTVGAARGTAAFASIDLRWSGQVVVRWRPVATPSGAPAGTS